MTWRASETQEGTSTKLSDSAVMPVKLRRLSSDEITARRDKALGGEKPQLINVSYFG